MLQELVLFSSVGIDCNRENWNLPLEINKVNLIYIIVSLYDVIIVLMTHDEYDYVIDGIILDILWLIDKSWKGLNCSHTDSPPLSVWPLCPTTCTYVKGYPQS